MIIERCNRKRNRMRGNNIYLTKHVCESDYFLNPCDIGKKCHVSHFLFVFRDLCRERD